MKRWRESIEGYRNCELSNSINYSDYRDDFTCRVAEARKRWQPGKTGETRRTRVNNTCHAFCISRSPHSPKESRRFSSFRYFRFVPPRVVVVDNLNTFLGIFTIYVTNDVHQSERSRFQWCILSKSNMLIVLEKLETHGSCGLVICAMKWDENTQRVMDQFNDRFQCETWINSRSPFFRTIYAFLAPHPKRLIFLERGIKYSSLSVKLSKCISMKNYIWKIGRKKRWKIDSSRNWWNETHCSKTNPPFDDSSKKDDPSSTRSERLTFFDRFVCVPAVWQRRRVDGGHRRERKR